VIYQYDTALETSLSSVSWNGTHVTVTDNATYTPTGVTGNVTFQISTNGTGGPFTKFGDDKILTGSSPYTVTSDQYNVGTFFWTSYLDSIYSTPNYTFDVDNQTVYMRGSGFPSGNYTVAYFDADGVSVFTDGFLNFPGGTLTSDYDLTSDPSAAAPGVWHAVVFRSDNVSTSYIPNDPKAVKGTLYFRAYYHDGSEEDTYSNLGAEPLSLDSSFYVEEDALPEFPTPVAGLLVIGFCGGVYWWMRKRSHAARPA
jgi:hypothetical protein